MILIADAGGTKTDWRLLDDKQISQFTSRGFNLKTQEFDTYLRELPMELAGLKGISRIYFYTAGLVTEQDAQRINARLESFYPGAKSHSFSDTLGAARSLFAAQAGYVCLLGTGAGAALYDGQEIAERVPSLGYILGDEGSGADLGRSLLQTYLRQGLPADLQDTFKAQFSELNEAAVLEVVYKQPGANAFLAQFVPFIVEHQNHPFVYQLVSGGFHRYFQAFFPDKEKYQGAPFRFIGSVAHLLSNILRRVASGYGYRIDLIAQSPIAGLTLYHQEHG
ncbi:N-acetylglucosamine kinase [Marinoscillum luteum]|jgi:N-acetylglucosamine kinase-like BadF-type ATPase|uniref:N-acetylglucosamine kinase n=1 Tax=Marinoscillum luteum TaxID=861051 RepID=A0ABW7N640_9BACT